MHKSGRVYDWTDVVEFVNHAMKSGYCIILPRQ
jgi:hypothetical protein